MLYSVVVGVFAAAVAWLVERALAALGRPRRAAWLAAIVATLVVPLLATALRPPVLLYPPPRVDSAPTVVVATNRVMASLEVAPALRAARVAGLSLDVYATSAWLLTSLSLLGLHALGAWRLARRARAWRVARVDAHEVTVAPDIGPAVYGWWRPRVVMPAWLLDAPLGAQRLALAHERQHVAARDPQWLAAATFLGAFLPWNLPLLWMLRRLRFALEVDCDARVLRAGAQAEDYGLALLFVSERQARAPLATLALIERASQLERRIDIMIATPRRYPALAAGLCLALAASCIVVAAQVDPPATLIENVPLKPTPAGGTALRLGQRFERLLLEEFPGVLDSDSGGAAGTAVIVVRLNADWSVDKAAKVVMPAPIEAVHLDEATFEAIGLARDQVPYVGAMRVQFPGDSGRALLVAYTERPQAAKPFVSNVFPDSRAVDRAIFQRYFPKAGSNGVPAGAGLWVLLDREGHVLRSGQEPLAPDQLNHMLEARFPGIRTEGVTVTPITDDAGAPVRDTGGNDLQLHSVWLAPGSPPPAT